MTYDRSSDDAQIVTGINALMRLAEKTSRTFSEREMWAFRAGLHASHAEEALLAGQPIRVRAHVKGFLKFARKLRGE